MTSKVEKATEKILNSEELSEKLKSMETIDDVISFYQDVDEELTEDDILEYLCRVLGIEGNVVNVEDMLENVCGGKGSATNKFLASMLGTLTMTTSVGFSPNVGAKGLDSVKNTLTSAGQTIKGGFKKFGNTVKNKWNTLSKAQKIAIISALGAAATVAVGTSVYVAIKHNKNKKVEPDKPAVNSGSTEIETPKVSNKKIGPAKTADDLPRQKRSNVDELEQQNYERKLEKEKERLEIPVNEKKAVIKSINDRAEEDLKALNDIPSENRSNLEILNNFANSLSNVGISENEMRSLRQDAANFIINNQSQEEFKKLLHGKYEYLKDIKLAKAKDDLTSAEREYENQLKSFKNSNRPIHSKESYDRKNAKIDSNSDLGKKVEDRRLLVNAFNEYKSSKKLETSADAYIENELLQADRTLRKNELSNLIGKIKSTLSESSDLDIKGFQKAVKSKIAKEKVGIIPNEEIKNMIKDRGRRLGLQNDD